MALPKDVTRCHDQQCSQRDDCQRFVERASGYLHSATLRTGAPIYCESKIPVEASAPMSESNEAKNVE